MATARIAIRLKGLQSATGLTAKLFAHTKAQNAAALATIATVTADTTDHSLYWMSLNATGLGGVIYHLAVYYSSGDDAGGGYVYLTDTTDVHEVQDSPAAAVADATKVNAQLGAGSGARTCVLTVQTSGAVAIQGATIRVARNSVSHTQTTNSSGQATFNLDDGTWTVAITAAGYTYNGTTLVVDGDETATYTMTANNISAPSAPNRSVGTLLCLGTDGTAEQGVVIYFRLIDGPGTAGYAYDEAEWSETSDANGEIESEFVIGARYRMRRGTHGSDEEFTVANAASFNIAEVVGTP